MDEEIIYDEDLPNVVCDTEEVYNEKESDIE